MTPDTALRKTSPHATESLKGQNPYTLPAGPELDEIVQKQVFASAGDPAPFSTDENLADKVKVQLKSLYGHDVVVGKTRIPSKRYFARFESGASTSTEVIAETYPLAICRLACVLAASRRGVARRAA